MKRSSCEITSNHPFYRVILKSLQVGKWYLRKQLLALSISTNIVYGSAVLTNVMGVLRGVY